MYANSCLGGWNNSNEAAGPPQADPSDPHSYSPLNSASIGNALAELYCGGFQGDIPPHTVPTHIDVSFNWVLAPNADGSALPPIIPDDTDASTSSSTPSSASTTDSSTSNASTTESGGGGGSASTPDDSNSSTPDTSGTTDTSTGSDSNSQSTPDSSAPAAAAPTPDAAPTAAPSAAPASDSSGSAAGDSGSDSGSGAQSLLFKSFRSLFTATPAYADDSADSGTSSDPSTTSPDISSQTAGNDSSTTATSSDASSTDTVLGVTNDDGLEVRYTLDGTTWNELGTVSRTALAGAHFEIPLTGIHTWDDLSHVQVSIRSVSSIDSATIVYLDSMQLQVQYGDGTASDDVSPAPFKVTDITNNDPNLALSVQQDDERIPQLHVQSPDNLGGVAMFDASGTVQFQTHVDAPGYTFSIASLPLGVYTIVRTTDPNSCETKSLDECEGVGSFVARESFVLKKPDPIVPTDPPQQI